ncbi:MAG TPA: hypothetical protein GX499_09970 [Clostridiales bacterium]|nr:hypothetical protein [Clostridiales bacterium]
MRIQKRRSRRGRAFLQGLLVLLLTAAVSFGGATVWQRLQDSHATESKTGIVRYSTGPSQSSEPSDNLSADVEKAEDVSQLEEEEAASAAEISLSFEAEFPSTLDDDAGEEKAGYTINPAFSVEGQVAESAKVDNSYFDDAIFFGDSISTGITAYNIANNTACVAAIGVSPNTALTTPYIPTRDGGKVTILEAAKAYGQRNKVYIMLGGNGLWQDKESFIADYQKFIDAVKEQYPGAIIYIQSMTPVARGVENKYPSVTYQKVLEYNQAIAQLAKDNNLPFVNVFEALCDEEGYLPEGVSADGLHLSAEYYFKWFDYLKSHTV